MRYFQRQPLDAAIQNQLSEKTSKNWTSLTENQRFDIVSKLIASQKHLCGYCECRILSQKEGDLEKQAEEDYPHIEHFEERHNAPTRVFDYANLLLSCEGDKTPAKKPEPETDASYRKSNVSCGHRKERGRHGNIEIDYSLLLNPTSEGVSALFSYFDGVIESCNSCTSEQIKQVEYTIRRLNLDTDRLQNHRTKKMNDIREELKVLTEDKQKEFIRALLDESQAVLSPYFSTIKDNFGFMLL
jgi:uncharacterized protein (TIGR02646 family)